MGSQDFTQITFEKIEAAVDSGSERAAKTLLKYLITKILSRSPWSSMGFVFHKGLDEIANTESDTWANAKENDLIPIWNDGEKARVIDFFSSLNAVDNQRRGDAIRYVDLVEHYIEQHLAIKSLGEPRRKEVQDRLEEISKSSKKLTQSLRNLDIDVETTLRFAVQYAGFDYFADLDNLRKWVHVIQVQAAENAFWLSRSDASDRNGQSPGGKPAMKRDMLVEALLSEYFGIFGCWAENSPGADRLHYVRGESVSSQFNHLIARFCELAGYKKVSADSLRKTTITPLKRKIESA